MATLQQFLNFTGLTHYNDKIQAWIRDYVAKNAPQPDLSAYLTAEDIAAGATPGTLIVDGTEVPVSGLGAQNGVLKTEGLIVDGDLTVKGTTTTESTVDNIIEGAITVVNGGAVESTMTLMGQVILTGTDSAYGILYDPTTEAIRLGLGTYSEESGFKFNNGEGEPIAVRDLGADDDGALVMWDADEYKLVSAPIVKKEYSIETSTYPYLKLADETDAVLGQNSNIFLGTHALEAKQLLDNESTNRFCENTIIFNSETASISMETSGEGACANSIIIGPNKISNEVHYTIAAGRQNTVENWGGGGAQLVLGQNNAVFGATTGAVIVAGKNNTTAGDINNVFLFGEGLEVSVLNQSNIALFGTYNVATLGDELFVIGNGSSDAARKNVLEIKTNGDIYLNGRIKSNDDSIDISAGMISLSTDYLQLGDEGATMYLPDEAFLIQQGFTYYDSDDNESFRRIKTDFYRGTLKCDVIKIDDISGDELSGSGLTVPLKFDLMNSAITCRSLFVNDQIKFTSSNGAAIVNELGTSVLSFSLDGEVFLHSDYELHLFAVSDTYLISNNGSVFLLSEKGDVKVDSDNFTIDSNYVNLPTDGVQINLPEHSVLSSTYYQESSGSQVSLDLDLNAGVLSYTITDDGTGELYQEDSFSMDFNSGILTCMSLCVKDNIQFTSNGYIYNSGGESIFSYSTTSGTSVSSGSSGTLSLSGAEGITIIGGEGSVSIGNYNGEELSLNSGLSYSDASGNNLTVGGGFYYRTNDGGMVISLDEVEGFIVASSIGKYTFGNTTITEDQLQQLLALLSNNLNEEEF